MDSTVDMADSDSLRRAFAIQHEKADGLTAGVTKTGVVFATLRAVKRIDGDIHVSISHGNEELFVILPPDDYRAFIQNATRLIE